MHLIPQDSLSSYHVAKSGVKVGLLQHPAGISTLGAVTSIGTRNGTSDGQTYLTLQSKLLSAIGSPENAFKHGINCSLDLHRDFSTILFQCLPDSKKIARSMLDMYLSHLPPLPVAIAEGQSQLRNSVLYGIVNDEIFFGDLAAAASFDLPSYKLSTYTGSGTKVNEDIIKSLSSEAILIGSNDAEKELTSLSACLQTNSKISIHEAPKFQPGTIKKAKDQNTLLGTKLVATRDFDKVVISYPMENCLSGGFLVQHVVKYLFGGGTWFSSDGLGSGTSSILYQNVLSKVVGCNSTFCYQYPMRDVGLLSFSFECSPEMVPFATECMKDSIGNAKNVTKDKVEAAKNRVIIDTLKKMDDEKRRFFEFAAEVNYYGTGKNPKAFTEAIEKITYEDVTDYLAKLTQSKPSVGVSGESDPNKIQDSLIV